VLENIAGQNKVITSIYRWVRFGDVEPRLPVVERIRVVELLCQEIGIARLVAEAGPLIGS